MALHLRFDHRFERLADALLESLEEAPGGPLAERTVIVPSIGVGRWLQRREAERFGVSARLRPEFAGRWLWRTMRSVLPGLPARSPFEPGRACWVLLELLGELPEEPGFALVRARVRQSGSTVRLALAESVAACFDRYLAYRRDWLARWQHGRWAEGDAPLGPHEAWQRWLWQRLLERLPDVRREHPYDQFVRCLEHDDAQVRRALAGTRVSLFGRVDLSPEQFALFGRLSASMDVSLFAPDPCRELWTDMLDARSLARVRAQRPDVAWLYEGEPSLLGNWGRAQRDFVAQVLSLEERFSVQAEAPGRDEAIPFAASGGMPAADCLHALQAAVFLRSDAPWRGLHAADASIVVAGAHGVVREAEVLHEALLESFESLPGLAPEEIVVYCADIESAAVAIEGVFASQPEARRIPVAVSGRAPAADPLIAAVGAMLSMPLQAVGAAALEEWLRNPAVMEALAVEAAEVEQLLHWFEAAGARRGLDEADGSPKHSLAAATDRLLLGAALGSAGVVGDLLAVPGAQGTRARVLDAWLRAADALSALRDAARAPRPLAEWCETAREAIESVFGPAQRHAASLQRVREALADLLEGAAASRAAVLDAQAFAHVFVQALEEGAGAAMPTGAVTVCPIGSLPGVPFRVVCLFGMDEGAFPRRGSRDELDLMRRAPRFGDRLARVDDRGAFLDAVLAARDRLVVTCQSRNPRDDTALNPSPLVAELLGYLSARLAGGAAASFEPVRRRHPDAGDAPALVEHPLHPFSLRNFEHAASRAQQWLSTARALARPLPARAAGIGALADVETMESAGTMAGDADGAVRAEAATDAAGVAEARVQLPASGGEEAPGRPVLHTVPIEALRTALVEPAATWLREALGVSLPREVPLSADVEPLWSADDERVLMQRCVERLLAGEDVDRLRHEVGLDPRTAAGAAGRAQAQAIVQRAAALVADALSLPDAQSLPRGGASPAPAVEATLDGRRLVMAAPALDAAGGPVFVSAFPLGAYALIDAWLRAALWRLARGEGAPARLVAPDARLGIACADPQHALRHALDWAQRIRCEPLALFPRTWLRHARTLARPARGGTEEAAQQRRIAARARARDTLLGTAFGPGIGELARPAAQALFRDAEPDLDRVLALAERVYGPILDDLDAGWGGEAAP